MSPPRDWLALRSDEGCKSRYPSRRPNTEKTYARENIMVAPPSPYSSRAKAFIWSRVMAPVMRAQSDSSRLPQRRPMVPACVLSRPAFHSPLDMRSSITCRRCTQPSTRESAGVGIKTRLYGHTAQADWQHFKEAFPSQEPSLLRKGLKCLAPTLGIHRIPFISQRAHGCRS